MTRLIIVRHGQSEANLQGIFAGQLDVELSELGHLQAERTAEYIAENYNIDRIYASDLKRAYGTAKHLADKLGTEIIKAPNMREINAGEWDGRKFGDLLKDYAEDYGVWINDIGRARCTGGETTVGLSERISAEIARIAEENEGKTVVIATHATPIRVMQCLWQGYTIADMNKISWVSNASVTVAELEGGQAELTLVGFDGHLEGCATTLPPNV